MRKKTVVTVALGLVIMVGGGLFVVGWRVVRSVQRTERAMAQSQKAFSNPAAVANDKLYCSNVIVPALNKYRHDNNRYPSRLEDLSPQYLASLAPPQTGCPRWHYWADPGGANAEIGFGEGTYQYPMWWAPVSGNNSVAWQLDS